jgi:hypothetical protein
MLIKDEHHLFCLHAVAAKAASLQTARRITGDGLASCMAAKLILEQGRQTEQSKKDVLN